MTDDSQISQGPITSVVGPIFRKGLLVGAILIQCLVSGYFVAGKLHLYWNDRWVQDDAYISFRFAKNWVNGNGLVYNVGEPVEGYTNFLWTVLSAIPLRMGMDDPLPFMHRLSLCLWIATYTLLIAIGARLFMDGVWIGPLAPIPLLFHWSYNMWFYSGMETPLVSFFVVLALFFFTFDPEKHPTALAWTSLSGLGLMLTRPDGVVIFPALSIAGLALYWRPLFCEKKWGRYVLAPALPILLLYIPYTLWRISFYGSFYPNTYYAKVAYLTYYDRGWIYLKGYLDVFQFAKYTPLAVAGAIVAGKTATGRFLLASILTTFFAFWYVVRLGGDFMEWRFVTPVTGVLYPSIVIGAGILVVRAFQGLGWGFRRITGRVPSEMTAVATYTVGRSLGWVCALVALVSFVQLTQTTESKARDFLVPGQETIALLRRYCDPRQYNWEMVSKVLAEVIPKNVRIATTSAGIIPFYCDRHCLDLHGLTDPVIAHEPVDPNNRGRMGHEHWLQDFNVMRERGVDIYLYWADPKPFAKSLATPPLPNFEMVSVKLPDRRYVEIQILNHDRVDLNELKKDDRLVFYDPKRVAEKESLHATRARFRDYMVIDKIDLENRASERDHDFKEVFGNNPPYGHNFHTKILPYANAPVGTIVEDEGLRLWHRAEWKARGISAEKPVVVVVRYDHTGGANYEIDVNGRKVEGTISCPGGTEVWDEAWIEIGGEYLVKDMNVFGMTRVPSSPTDSELYYIWILQPKQ